MSAHPTFPASVVERVLANTRPIGECIESRYSVGSHGYTQVGWHAEGHTVTALCHRVAWVAVNGPIPDDLTIDHICRNRRCIRVDHLRLLTNVDNARDNGMARRTHCPAGHAYDETNTYIDPENHRRCRTCAAINARRAA